MYPPFPNDVPNAQLSTVFLEKLLLADRAESDILYVYCKTLRFFLLDLTTTPQGGEIFRNVGKPLDFAKTLFEEKFERRWSTRRHPGEITGKRLTL